MSREIFKFFLFALIVLVTVLNFHLIAAFAVVSRSTKKCSHSHRTYVAIVTNTRARLLLCQRVCVFVCRIRKAMACLCECVRVMTSKCCSATCTHTRIRIHAHWLSICIHALARRVCEWALDCV